MKEATNSRSERQHLAKAIGFLKAMVGIGAVARFTGFIHILVGVLGLTPQALRFRRSAG